MNRRPVSEAPLEGEVGRLAFKCGLKVRGREWIRLSSKLLNILPGTKNIGSRTLRIQDFVQIAMKK